MWSDYKTVHRQRAVNCMLLLVCCLMLQVPLAVAADESVNAMRPRIGLVLGGGGARGAAHVGVLKVLEEMRIPVDYVVGTSMGSVVGGLYASGMTSAKIEQELLTMAWTDLFDDYPPREDRSFRRKRDDDLNTIKGKIGYNHGEIEIPLAYIRGQKLDLTLNRLTLPVVGIKDFDKLPIPYRAVATDLETGKEVVLRRGNLSKSIRASMAVPAAFDPVEIDSRVLVDGGIANNVPISVARAMGAEVVIAVDVGSGLYRREDITNALDVSAQLTNFLFTLNSEAQLKTLTARDVLIRPPLGEIGGGAFDRVAEAIPTGVLGAKQVRAALQRYSLSEAQYAQHRARQRITQSGIPVIDFVRIENQSALSDEVIAARISLKPGDMLNIEQLERDIGQLYGLELFQSVRYEVIKEDGRTGLLITATERYWGPGYIQLSLAATNNLEGDAQSRLGLVYLLTEINSLGGEWRSGIQVGDEFDLFTELYQPLDAYSRYFVTGKLGYNARNINQFDSAGNRLARYRVKALGFELGTGREFGTWGEVRLGYRRATGEAEISIGTPAPVTNVDRGEVFLKLSDDRMDNLYFPRTGHLGFLEYRAALESLGASRDYEQWQFKYIQAFSWGQNTLIGMLSGGITQDDDAPVEGLFETGGFLRLSGLQEDQLAGQHAGLIGLVYMRKLTRVQLIKLFDSFAGVSLETGNVWQHSRDISFDNTITAGSVFLGFDTPIGPFYLGYGRTDTDQRSAYIYLGPRFTF